MKAFRKRGRTISSRLASDEVMLLSSLTAQLIELLSETEQTAAPEPRQGESGDDPFALWEADLQENPDEPEISDDPVVQRLFPNAYPHDPAASSDFRRFTERDQRASKIADAERVLATLERTREGHDPVRIEPDERDAWLRTLTALRLSVAVRLGITDTESAEELSRLPDSDPRAFMGSVYEWLGFAQESLLASL